MKVSIFFKWCQKEYFIRRINLKLIEHTHYEQLNDNVFQKWLKRLLLFQNEMPRSHNATKVFLQSLLSFRDNIIYSSHRPICSIKSEYNFHEYYQKLFAGEKIPFEAKKRRIYKFRVKSRIWIGLCKICSLVRQKNSKTLYSATRYTPKGVIQK